MVDYIKNDKMKIQNKHINIRILLLLVSSFFFTPLLKAQFTITENFKGSSVASNIILGGNPSATLTSGVADPLNNGWLRLTTDAANQRGFAYINTPFPSTLGVYIEFEYKTWRSRADNTYNGADGFSVFLFDANTPFRIGGFGGSLGYAQNADSNPKALGLAGAYLGIGFDEYGNYVQSSEGKIGGTTSLRPNSIALRGPESRNYLYLNHNQLQTSPSLNGVNSIDYNTVTTTRPTDAQFYRRVKVFIEPIGTPASPKYRVRVLWRTTPTGSDVSLVTYGQATNEVIGPIPSNLKMGFAASTGGGFNYHEIRNLLITTTGGVRVQKEVDKVNALPGEQLTYTINVYNENVLPVTNLKLTDNIKDGNGNLINLSDFQISSITFNNNEKANNTASGFTSGLPKTTGFTNPFSTTMTLDGNASASFTIVGTVKNSMAGKVLKNSVELDVSDIGFTDSDLTNNFSTVSTTILNPNVDLKIEKGISNNGIAQAAGNTYTIVVSNVSSINKPATNADKKVSVTDVIPAGLTIIGTPSGTGWTLSQSGNNLTFTRRDALQAQYAYPPITINVTPIAGGGPWTNAAILTYADDTNTENNSSSVDLRWVNYWHGTIDTDWAKIGNWTANYVPTSGQDIEFATTANNGPSGDGNKKGAAIKNLHLDKDRIIGDLINKSDKDLIVTTENQLIINEQVRSDNTGGIVVNATHDKASGTLIFKKSVFNSNVKATVQFYNKAYACDNCGFFRKQWQYFGIPVRSAEFPYNDIEGDETVNKWDETFNGDKWQVVSGALDAFKGYQITNSSNVQPTGVYNLKGVLNVSDASVALTKTNAVNYSGTNLVSNSYTAAIPISADAMTFPTGTEQTVYLFNTGTRDQWRKLNGSAINQSGYKSGQYLAVPVNLGGTANFPDRIPSMHAFMLQTSANGSLNINYNKLIKNTAVNLGDGTQITTRSVGSFNNASFSEQANTIQQLPSLVMDVIGEESADRVWIFQQSSATHDFDNGWDGRKMLEEGIAQLYVNTTKGDSKLQVATVPELKGVTLGFVPDRDGKFTLDFSLSGQLKQSDIYLHDAVTGTTQLVGEGKSYSFSAKKGDAANRFSLSYSNKNTFLTVDESLLEVTATNDGKIMVINSSKKSCSVFVYDAQGSFLQQVEVKAKNKAVMSSFVKGTYMVRLQNSEVNDVRRVTLK